MHGQPEAYFSFRGPQEDSASEEAFILPSGGDAEKVGSCAFQAPNVQFCTHGRMPRARDRFSWACGPCRAGKTLAVGRSVQGAVYTWDRVPNVSLRG